ncbi:hypothetical protein ACMFMG_007825 [Clarireedia jacksonii]
MAKRRPTKAQRNMRKRRAADPATQAWIESCPINQRASQISASKTFYGISTDLQIMIMEYALRAHEPDTIVVSASLLNDAYYIHKPPSTKKGSRALLEVNALSRELALKKFSGSLRTIPVPPLPAFYKDPTPVLSTLRFDPVNDIINIRYFYHMVLHIFPGLAHAFPLRANLGRAADNLEKVLYQHFKHEYQLRLLNSEHVHVGEGILMKAPLLLSYRKQLWKLSSSIQNLRISFRDLDLLTGIDTRPSFQQVCLKTVTIVDFLLSNKSLKKVIIEKPYWEARSREGRRRTVKGDAWVLDFSREGERRLQKRERAEAEKMGVELTVEDLETVQTRSLVECILFILSASPDSTFQTKILVHGIVVQANQFVSQLSGISTSIIRLFFAS